MSFFEKLNKGLLRSNLSEAYLSGMFYTTGDIESLGNQNRTLIAGGTTYSTSTQLGKNAVVQKVNNEFPLSHKIGAATTGLGAAYGFYQGGFSGMTSAVTSDIAISSALASYGHSSFGGAAYYGKYVGQSLMKDIPYLGKTANALSYMNKTLWAGAGQAVGSSFLGPIGGTVSGMYGAHLGARYSGALTVGAGIAAGASLVGYGAYSILQAGLEHQQNRRSVQFSGDTAAFMTNAAATQRQRAVQAMQKSHMNARSALGQEAILYSGRNYFRRY